MSKKTKNTLSSVMDARRKSIQSKSRMLVECILAKDPLTANKIFPGLVTESQTLRELEVQKLIMEDDEDFDFGDDDTGDDVDDTEDDDFADDDTEGDDAEDETDDAESDEMTDEEMDAADDETNQVVDDAVEIQCQINAKVIENLFNVIADLKSGLNNQDLDETSKEFITLDTTIAFYSDKLQELQSQTNPGTDQTKLEEKLDSITQALDELKEQIDTGVSDDDVEAPEDVEETEEGTEEDFGEEEGTEEEGTEEDFGEEEGTEEEVEEDFGEDETEGEDEI